jgi:hypothetical protein
MIPKMEEIWGDFPIINTWDDVLDTGISTGVINWQLYGSQKPNHEPYKLTSIHKVTYNENDECKNKTERNYNHFSSCWSSNAAGLLPNHCNGCGARCAGIGRSKAGIRLDD